VKYFKPFSTLALGAILGTFFGQKVITKVRG